MQSKAVVSLSSADWAPDLVSSLSRGQDLQDGLDSSSKADTVTFVKSEMLYRERLYSVI